MPPGTSSPRSLRLQNLAVRKLCSAIGAPFLCLPLEMQVSSSIQRFTALPCTQPTPQLPADLKLTLRLCRQQPQVVESALRPLPATFSKRTKGSIFTPEAALSVPEEGCYSKRRARQSLAGLHFAHCMYVFLTQFPPFVPKILISSP